MVQVVKLREHVVVTERCVILTLTLVASLARATLRNKLGAINIDPLSSIVVQGLTTHGELRAILNRKSGQRSLNDDLFASELALVHQSDIALTLNSHLEGAWQHCRGDALHLSIVENKIQIGLINEVISESNVFALDSAGSVADGRGGTQLVNCLQLMVLRAVQLNRFADLIGVCDCEEAKDRHKCERCVFPCGLKHF